MTTVTATPGFVTRRANFSDEIEFYAPGLKRWEIPEWKPANPRGFLPVSVTGQTCALRCDHCATNALKGMLTVHAGDDLFDLACRLRAEGSEGILVSGGSASNGAVPLGAHFEAITRIKAELDLRVIVHTGVVAPRVAEELARAGVDGVMLDVIGADETIRDVYHLDLTVADFERSIALLAGEGLRIIPHLVLGLHYGQFLGEHRALDIVGRYPVSTLILVVLVPIVGTPMEHLPPPPVDDVISFFETARLAMPTTTVNLGCARPLGDTKVVLDRAAIDHGLNGIAYPAPGTIEYARERGLAPRLYEYCCSLTWLGGGHGDYREVTLG